MGYQPKNKSFEYYISIGYEYASGKKMTNRELNMLKDISNIDTSIIKIDDILDKEGFRNGNKCIYLIDGIDKTIINAKLDEIAGVEALTRLIDFKKVFPDFSYEILKVFNNNYMRGIYEGQKIDKELEELSVINDVILDKYFIMVKKFTGGHIRYGLEIGQLLAGKLPDKNIGLIGELLGVNRQIIDDFEDYFKAHHNPFGDLKRGAKRLPEILFTLSGGDRKEALKYIENRNFKKLISYVLNEKVRNSLYKYCVDNLNICLNIKTNFDHSLISIDPNIILSKK